MVCSVFYEKNPKIYLGGTPMKEKVEAALNEIRPMLQQDGGDLELIDIKERSIYVRLGGACSTCVGANKTIKLLVERTLKDQVDDQIKVIQV